MMLERFLAGESIDDVAKRFCKSPRNAARAIIDETWHFEDDNGDFALIRALVRAPGIGVLTALRAFQVVKANGWSKP